ncbi:GIY-YIG nuclease family protein [Lysobacter korlensis]|uniref:GIY-YIG nuclease family protein n=1 Tax=Lysobacter korlensis TaxID=553636 RepID=A0ABV6RKX5_9GAMM
MCPVDLRDPAGGTASRGPSFLYIAPCAYEDLLKLGFSRDPLERLRSLHPRFHEVFDLDRTMLVGTETVRDARALELKLRRRLVEYNAPAPLVMRAEAGGGTEWYRGAYGVLEDAVAGFATEGYPVHRSAGAWMRHALEQRAPLLYSWTQSRLSVDELDGTGSEPVARRVVLDTLDSFAALGIDLEPWLSPDVMAWYRRLGR